MSNDEWILFLFFFFNILWYLEHIQMKQKTFKANTEIKSMIEWIFSWNKYFHMIMQ